MSGNETLKNMLSHVFERIVLKRRTDGIDNSSRGAMALKRSPSCAAIFKPASKTSWPTSSNDRRLVS